MRAAPARGNALALMMALGLAARVAAVPLEYEVVRRLSTNSTNQSLTFPAAMTFTFTADQLISLVYFQGKFDNHNVHINITNHGLNYQIACSVASAGDAAAQNDADAVACANFCFKHKKIKCVRTVASVNVEIHDAVYNPELCKAEIANLTKVCEELRYKLGNSRVQKTNRATGVTDLVLVSELCAVPVTPPAAAAEDSTVLLAVIIVAFILLVVVSLAAFFIWSKQQKGGTHTEAEMEAWDATQSTLATIGDEDILANKSTLEVGKEIGRGQFGIVFKGTWKHPQEDTIQVAVKQLVVTKKDLDLFTKITADFKAEVDIMHLFAKDTHPNIVRFHGCVTEPQLCVVLDLALRGALFGLLRKGFVARKHRGVSTAWALDCAKGLQYLHNTVKMVHRDMKSLNVLVDADWKLTLTDFGQTILLRDIPESSTGGQAGTPYWTAPECFMGARYTPKADVYSFAMTLFEIETNNIPWDVGNMEVGYLVARQKKRPAVPANFEKNMLNVMTNCWLQDPGRDFEWSKDRPTERWSMDKAVLELERMQALEGPPQFPDCALGEEPFEEEYSESAKKALAEAQAQSDESDALLDEVSPDLAEPKAPSNIDPESKRLALRAATQQRARQQTPPRCTRALQKPPSLDSVPNARP